MLAKKVCLTCNSIRRLRNSQVSMKIKTFHRHLQVFQKNTNMIMTLLRSYFNNSDKKLKKV